VYRQRRRYTYRKKGVGKGKKAVLWIRIGFNVDPDPAILKINNFKNSSNSNIFNPRHP
jgi:hypothetical protein